jgi:ElaB/YqjD/DUF883 family membrane-anchored ribosome-binding protein
MIAQAMLEKSFLDGLSWGVANVVDIVGSLFQQRPWLVVAVAVVIGLLLIKRK